MRPLLLLLLLAPALLPPAAEARPLALGFFDIRFIAFDDAVRAKAYQETGSLGSDVVRVSLPWAGVAPRVRPLGVNLADPAASVYDWRAVDVAVRDASARSLRVLLTLDDAPAWAEGRGRPPSAAEGTWRPSPAAAKAFATAAARRYSGRHPDPRMPGSTLPRVRHWQIWNEPNLAVHLSPQWERRGKRLRLASPGIYRALLNAAYAGVKSAHRDNVVVTGGTAPYGDRRRGGSRVMPARFLRSLLCVSARLRPLRCPRRARFDVLSHHPYAIRGPRSHALNADDAAIPDVRRLTRIVRAAVRHRRVLPARRKRTWVTELSWDSRPPDPEGVPAATHARWLADSFYELWRQGVDTITWFQVRDQLPEPSFGATHQSGVLLADGRPKRAAAAFRFPFVLRRAGSRVLAWGRAPATGPIIIERRVGGAWQPLRSLRAGKGAVFTTRPRLAGPVTLRARSGTLTSLPYTTR